VTECQLLKDCALCSKLCKSHRTEWFTVLFTSQYILLGGASLQEMPVYTIHSVMVPL